MNSAYTDHTIALPDGRTLGYALFGPDDGDPVLYCHGNFGSRLDPLLVRPETLAHIGVRLIAPDRPGIGLSTFQPERRIRDWPADVTALADALGLEQFALMGLSAGSPFTAVCALTLPERLTRVALVSAVAPLAGEHWEGMNASGTYFSLARRSAHLASLLLALTRFGMRDEEKFITQATASMPGPDQQALLADERVRAGFLATMEASLSSGLRGLAYDAALIARPWGFELELIAKPVQVWHGEADRNAPPAMGRYLAEAIPDSSLRLVPEEGHFSLAVHYFEEILQGLVGRAGGGARI